MTYDLILRNGNLYDGSGNPPAPGDLAIQGEFIAAMGDLRGQRARQEIDVDGLAVAPGFINMLSWACESLLVDGRSQSDIRQGVTLEVMGEGFSYGPLNDALRAWLYQQQGDFKFEAPWNTLDEYLEGLVGHGVSTNVASFVGTATLRAYVMGFVDRPPTADEMAQILALGRQALAQGALGVSTALAYVPDIFYRTQDLIPLARLAAEHDSMFIAHMRGEGERLLEGIDEMIEIARVSGARTEIYHFKAAGWRNWGKLDDAVQKINAARAAGLPLTADIYPYAASASGLDLCMPPWVQEGGIEAWIARLKDPEVRQRLRQEMAGPGVGWENALDEITSPDGILFAAFKNPALRHYTGKTLGEVAALRGASPVDTVIDLVIEDESRVGVVFFTMSEDNLRKQVALPWVSLCSDAGSLAPEGVFLSESTHPRAYGSFARFLGRYCRDEGIIPLEEAVRRLTALPAANLKLDRRGALQVGHYADVVVFDPAAVQDHATFTEPHQYSTGVRHVLVNGVPVLLDGEHSGATPGRVVRGPGVPRSS